jgi:hypothetical protein
MSKEVVVKNDFQVSNEFSEMFDTSLGMGAGENIDNDDIIIPKIHLAQALTPEAQGKDSTVEVGSYMNSVDKTALGDEMDIIVIGKVKLWQFYYEVKEGKKTKKEYLGTIPWTTDNKDLKDMVYLPKELEQRAEDKGVKVEQLLKPDRILRFSVLKLDEVMGGFAFPYFVDFKRSSYPAGQQLESIFAKMRSVNLPSYAKVFSLGSKFVQDEYDYYVKSVSLGRNIDKKELQAVEHWVKELSQNAKKYKADESTEQENYDDAVEVEATEVNTNTKF